MSETTAQDVLFAALEFRAAGISVVPVREDGSKAPARNWKEFQERLAEPSEILASLSNAQGFGIVTGAISGQLEMLELEGRAINAGGLYKARLGWALIGSDGGENSELALGHRAGTGLFYKEVQSHLQHPVQQVAWRSVQINQAVV
jgi:hypothetical protein